MKVLRFINKILSSTCDHTDIGSAKHICIEVLFDCELQP